MLNQTCMICSASPGRRWRHGSSELLLWSIMTLRHVNRLLLDIWEFVCIYIHINIHILWIGLHSHWQRAPQPAKLSSSFSNQRTASKQDCPKWQGFMDMQGSATTRVVWSPRLSARTASSRSSKWLNARYPSLLPWPYGLAWASVCCERWIGENLKAGRDSMSSYDLWWMQRWWIYNIYIYVDTLILYDTIIFKHI